MWTTLVATFILIFTVAYSRILLYDTENKQAVEKFDCVYYMHGDGEEIPYCLRPGASQRLDRKEKTCENQGEMKLFRDLISQGVSPSNILDWSSSVEMTDEYASVFYNKSLIENDDDRFVCNCTKSGTFGKYCEYQLTHDAKSFSEATKAQFHEKKNGDSWNTQRYGKILCYETLSCNASSLCLDWRDICDGLQQCPNGIDEENWDKLEFSECDDDQFRCTNGMCIPEEFWFDGSNDCMDWSDEVYMGDGESCSFEPNTMECDEHLCEYDDYSCGDGQCISWPTRLAFQRVLPTNDDCFNKRNLNYMCEVSRDRRAWTLKSGSCCSDEGYNDPRYPPWKMINSSQLSKEEICQYLFRCVLSDGFEFDCPCNRENCTQIMMNVCSSDENLVLYPPEGLINPNLFFYFNYSRSMKNPSVDIIEFFGSLKCRGYRFTSRIIIRRSVDYRYISNPRIHHLLCVFDQDKGYRDMLSSLQYDKFCWNESLTFNGRPYAVNPDVCYSTEECLSQYRIHDGYDDCLDYSDEDMIFENSHCTGNVGRHRFQCFNDQQKCLSRWKVGTGKSDCLNNYDEIWYGIGLPLSYDVKCWKPYTEECNRWKEYIQQSSNKNSSGNSLLVNVAEQLPVNQIPFRSYCNSVWDLKNHIDELSSSCQHWVCSQNQYQCQSGQCIELDWVCDGEWDCSDASDEEGIAFIQKWSDHNANLSGLNVRRKYCLQQYSQLPFSKFCNTSFEFGCYRSQVLDPLNIELNRPCINLTQIGDGIEDCYNAYDEKNTLEKDSTIYGMLGFALRCKNHFTSFPSACSILDRTNCTKVLCLNHRDESGLCSGKNDVICLENNHCKQNARCDGEPDCLHGEDEYWCASGSINNQINYRYNKRSLIEVNNPSISPLFYPSSSVLMTNHQQKSKSSINFQNGSSSIPHSYQCNRGVAILHINETRCLCSPAYYGRWCEFFSDRISIFAHIDQKTLPKSISNITLKIRTNFLFNDIIIDHYEFAVIPLLIKNIKHKFYLLYSRSSQMLAHKQKRYFNQSDVIHNHPYSVHFDVFFLESNSGSMRELGSWHYPIYFDYLPAFRLAVVLRFPPWYGNDTLNPCSKSICNKNSTCLPIFNQNNSLYCSCKSGYYGKDCSMYEPRCETYCSADALCRREDDDLQINKNSPYCICPLNRFGSHCNLKSDGCISNPCLNNGTCLSTYDLNREASYMCNCSERFYGNKCQNAKASVHIDLNMTDVSSAYATVLQLYDMMDNTLALIMRHQKVYYGLPSTIRYDHADFRAPLLGVIKLYEDIANPQYFIMYLLNKAVINIISSPQHCPHASLLLSKDISSSVPDIFKYHHICRNDTQRLCFHDAIYLCICQQDHYRVECVEYDSQVDHCDKCLSGGKCLQGDRKDFNDFICLCPSCYRGRRCEFSMHAFGFTLDSLLTGYSKVAKVVFATIAFLLFTIGLFNNLCSFMTFKRPMPRKFGTGNYLFIVTCINQITLLCLLFKFIHVAAEASNIESCKTVSYLLSVVTRSTYWLTSWVTVDRLFIIIFPNSTALKNRYLAIGISMITMIIILSTHVHEIIYYTTIQSILTGSSTCVTNFSNNLVLIYNRISTLIHYLVPFFIQVISITVLIILIARSRIKTIGSKMTFRQVLSKQFQTQKELFVTPMIIALSALPQAILTFSLACTELTDWQRHTLISAYLFSYAPQVLGFILYVLPSTSYKKELGETLIAKKFLKPLFDKKKDQANGAKEKK